MECRAEGAYTAFGKIHLMEMFINGGAYLLLYVMLCSRYEKFILRKYH